MNDNDELTMNDVARFALLLFIVLPYVLSNTLIINIPCHQDSVLCVLLGFYNTTIRLLCIMLQMITLLSIFYMYHDPSRDTIFSNISDDVLNGVLFLHLFTIRGLVTRSFRMSVGSDMIEGGLLEDPTAKLFRLCYIDVYCDNEEELQRLRSRYQATHNKLRFCRYKNLKGASHAASSDSVICSLCTAHVDLNKRNDHYLAKDHQQVILNNILRISSVLRNTNRECIVECDCIRNSISLLSSDAVKLDDFMQKISREVGSNINSYQTCMHELRSLNELAEETDIDLSIMIARQNVCSQELQAVKQQCIDRPLLSLDGVLIWKIIDVRQKMDDARFERQRSIYSSEFYSSNFGYKMCSRLFLNGVNTARDTHLSIFFILRRHDYDAVLKWPFPFRVIFSLLDQSLNEDNQYHFHCSFWPNAESRCFRRPLLEMNEAYGFEKFISLDRISGNQNRYVRDDTMFIKIELDCTSEPPALPFDAGEMLMYDNQHTDTNEDDSLRMFSFNIENPQETQ